MDMHNYGHWNSSLLLSEGYKPYGFVYIITNLVNGKRYIGKKQMVSVRKLKPLKGMKKRRLMEVETDWATYTSSSVDLNNDINELGKDNFDFSIVRFCDSKFEMAYFESKLQFEHDVLLKPGFYNGIINCRIGRAPASLLEKL